MLSRLIAASMPSSTKQNLWDIFCAVIDNYGDIGVCWRLALQLVDEHDAHVRLWVDDLGAFQRICSVVDPRLKQQNVNGVDLHRWDKDFAEIEPGDVVVEAFACRLPESFEEAMARRPVRPCWINLDYLSAEAWISGCHALPSPHPRLPLIKYFLFPGFDETTGGLLRERDLAQKRSTFCASREQQADFWRRIDQPPPAADSLLISLFAYENPVLPGLLDIWADSPTPVCCLAPVTRTLPAIEAFTGSPLRAGDVIRRGQLEIRMLPFASQDDYDRLLWLCDINFVRGEDSFVRAQWAAKPFLWHIYPQDDNAHRVKLAAFLDRYCADLPKATSTILRQLMETWNGDESGDNQPLTATKTMISPTLWASFMNVLPDLREKAVNWEKIRSKQEDLCTSLFRFSRSKL